MNSNRFQCAALVDAAGSCPIENVRESPGILIEVQLQLAFLIENQLRCRKQLSGALAPVLRVEFEHASGQAEGLRLRVGVGFAKTNLTIGDEYDLAPGRCPRHFD